MPLNLVLTDPSSGSGGLLLNVSRRLFGVFIYHNFTKFDFKIIFMTKIKMKDVNINATDGGKPENVKKSLNSKIWYLNPETRMIIGFILLIISGLVACLLP